MNIYKLLLLIIFSIFIFPNTIAQEKYGKEITLEEKTEIKNIILNPDAYLEKKVLVEGKILAVCKMAGCWMQITDENGEKIRVKVKDGEIVFPKEAIGKTALVEGEVNKIELNEEDAKDYFEHMAEESGEEFEPSTINGAITIYQLKGIGAVIN